MVEKITVDSMSRADGQRSRLIRVATYHAQPGPESGQPDPSPCTPPSLPTQEQVGRGDGRGIVLRGHDELGDFLTGMFDHFDAEVAEEESSNVVRLSTRYLGPGVIVHSTNESTRTTNRDDLAKPRRVHRTVVLERRQGEWKIVHVMIMDARL